MLILQWVSKMCDILSNIFRNIGRPSPADTDFIAMYLLHHVDINVGVFSNDTY